MAPFRWIKDPAAKAALLKVRYLQKTTELQQLSIIEQIYLDYDTYGMPNLSRAHDGYRWTSILESLLCCANPRHDRSALH
jgi:hypothetical protein